ncbi:MULTISPECIES: lipopolysaccharide biosynthesis protein [unclassified Novosphingobium]|uniref:lipopolysaccharide biosynthesis protein n=1 Tax=unclassified Novosphingobium TaxID=2644732 RepID=UPI00145AE430|nr:MULTISPECIES: hypothetical protein [unclassified Novosphingobium]MBB3360521.1 O-antigen/teichoic acid export membrane protein [Novosphingobium sp. BK256]MBB3376903.1 O-antigen/teichoic acid export membrane protein [Novosphingobium sp. BK280]MBB3381273.1 O-antigen/teichoic acid export membrane protein [Novosphingobium sp. BK258]MBB3422965.1 O-antigen/teichoic acid export membrane protein [Novosphingobium sp. BK267]MBB3451667.1 O-antigen/teichoic acid export membrane protein [Novosphingobium 
MLKRVTAGIGVNIIDKAIVSGSQLALVPMLTWRWGVHLYGLWILLATIPNFLAMGDFGFATAAGTKMIMAEARGDRDQAIETFQSAWVAILTSSFVMVVLALAVSMWVPIGIFGSDPGLAPAQLRATTLTLLLYGIAVIQGTIFFAGFRCAGMFALGAFWNAIIILIESCALIMVVALGAQPPVAALALLSGRMVGLAGQNLILRRKVPWLTIGFAHARRAEVKSLFAPAGAVMLLPLAQAGVLQGSALALGAAAGQAAVPAFTAARTLSRIGLQFCWLLNAAIMPEVSAAIARDDRQGLAMMEMATIAVTLLFVVPFALVFGVLGTHAILLWSGGRIHTPQSLVTFLAMGIVFGGFWYPLSNLILAANRQSSYTPPYLVLSLLSIPLTYFACRSLGVSAAGLSMMVLDLLMLVVVCVLAQRVLVPFGQVARAWPEAVGHLGALRRRLRSPRT